MVIDFTCVKCEGGFEIDSEDLADGTEKLECPHCGNKTTKTASDDFVAALTEATSQIVALSKKFGVSIALETEDLADKGPALDDDDEDEEEEDDDVDADDDDDLDEDADADDDDD